jgi:demethylmenaquinone methyltransferase/2-methoxy-6-polyprenyl-1,4-benzoquinol methylase
MTQKRRQRFLPTQTSAAFTGTTQENDHKNPEQTWFGSRFVNPAQKTAAVEGVFASVAERYDLMNDIMSFGVHRLWKDRFVRAALLGKLSGPSAKAGGPNRFPPSPRGRVRVGDKRVGDSPPPAPPLQGGEILRIIDVAGGTGDIAFRLHRATKGQADITVADLTPEMLRVGQARAIDCGIISGMTFQQANAEILPYGGDTFDLYTIAFGLRNVTRIDTALHEAYRVLKPGGRLACLEFSQVQDRALDTAYQLWSRAIPALGAMIAHDRDSYQYLVESIRAFPTQVQLKRRMLAAGFDAVRVINLTGGIAAIHVAEKY